jgi:NAD(P)-dependent dehydrogenase (short-subunit alcohol dehydrogenase family)
MIKSVMITGANAGLGKECARQIAGRDGIEKIYLACRNMDRAREAKASLEAATGKSVFEIVLMDVSDPGSVRKALDTFTGPVDALLMNAGGTGGPGPGKKTPDGVTRIFAANVLGHVVLLDELIKAGRLGQVAVYVGSEAARGVPMMGMAKPALSSSSADEFASICDGSFFKGSEAGNGMKLYGPVKYVAAMAMASAARRNPSLRIVTMSPGGTAGTDGTRSMPFPMNVIMKYVAMNLMLALGKVHGLETGARRLVDTIFDAGYESGYFYASVAPGVTGKVVDQADIAPELGNPAFQDHAYDAVHRFVR